MQYILHVAFSLQCSFVMDVKADATINLGLFMLCYASLMYALTLLKASSIGFKSGLYGGKKHTSAPAAAIMELVVLRK